MELNSFTNRGQEPSKVVDWILNLYRRFCTARDRVPRSLTNQNRGPIETVDQLRFSADRDREATVIVGLPRSWTDRDR